MKKILYIVAALVLASCSRDEITGSGSGTNPGSAVPVVLNLLVEPMLSPDTGTRAAVEPRTADGKRVIASDQSGAMLMELIEEPETPATRATDDATIANYWVFQFDGTDATSKLVKMTYHSTPYTPGTTDNFSLIPGTNQRVVVIANTFDATFNSGWTLNATTYQSLLDKSATVTTDPSTLFVSNGVNLYTPMSGTFTGTLTAEASAQNITLKRNMAQITFKVMLGTNVLPYSWTAQLFDVPNAQYWMSDRTDAPFPATVTALTYTPTTITPNTADYTTLYDALPVPVNRRGIISGRVGKDRNVTPPTGAMCIKLIGTSTNDTTTYTYTIHLGENFTDDYNLNPNTKYTYQVTLLDDLDDTDSRVTISRGIYVGMFGGELKNTDGVWQYTKALYVNETDASTGSKWSENTGNHNTWAGSTTDGKANTWNMNRGTELPTIFTAAKRCFDKNNSPSNQTDPKYTWYLPAQEQLIAAWITHGATKTFGTFYYWSSSSFDLYNTSWYVSFSDGDTYGSAKGTNHRVRCVREITP